MLSFIQKRLELKIIIAMLLVIGLVISVFTAIDIRMLRADTVRAAEHNLQALAAAVKGSVNAAMRKGHRQDVQRLLEEVRIPSLISRITVYSEQGRLLKSAFDERRTGLPAPGEGLSPDTLQAVAASDRTEVRRSNGVPFLSYYSPIANTPECHRCHGSRNRFNGILRIDFSLHDTEALFLSRRRRILIWTAVMVAALAVALVTLLRVVVHRPVRELRDAITRAADGNEPMSLAVNGEDELADLKGGFVAMLAKIHALHRTNIEKEKELARNQEIMRFRMELKTMFDAMPDGVLLVDKEFRIIQSNPRAHALLPALDEAAGRIDTERMKQSGCPHHGIQNALQDGKVCEHQCSIKLANGDPRHLHSICAPIREDGRVVSVVAVVRDITERVKTERELEEKTAELVATNKLLSKIAITDSLTRVYNRRHFDELLHKEIKRYNRRKYSFLSLLMVDIDHFKKLNDQYGHVAGDAVLVEVAKLLQEGIRETDTIARYGGEEFAIVMPDTHLDGAVFKAETLRSQVEEREFPGQQGPLHITISIGVASCVGGTPHEFVNAADRALYEAKHAGRNRVLAAGPGTVEQPGRGTGSKNGTTAHRRPAGTRTS